MQTKQNDMSPGDAQAALAWLIEMGADEIVGEAPVNRFAAVVAPPVVAAPSAKAAPAVAAPSSADACNSLDELQAALLALDDFPLKKTASNLCFAGGDATAQVMIIGDVPGRDEDIEGKVFAGQNLLLLERMLGAIGLSVASTSSFNFIPWRPPGNRTPTDAELQTVPALYPAGHRALPAEIHSLPWRPSGAAPVGQERRAAFAARQMV